MGIEAVEWPELYFGHRISQSHKHILMGQMREGDVKEGMKSRST